MAYNPRRRTIAGEPIARVVVTVGMYKGAWWVIDKQTGGRVTSDYKKGRGFVGGGTLEMAVAAAMTLAKENDFDYEPPPEIRESTEAQRVHDSALDGEVTNSGIVLPPGVATDAHP